MTSGEFVSYPLSSIYVDRENRQRKIIKPEAVAELAESIRRTGLIHPPIIERDGKLRVGERRFMALTHLGWTHIPVQFVDELSEHELQLLELEENVRRVDLTWQDECAAIELYHSLKTATEGTTWNQAKTAESLGMSPINVSQKIAVAKEIKTNERVAKADKFSIAHGITRRTTERRKEQALATIVPEKEEKTIPLLLSDFREWHKTYTGPRFNFIHCDFPYGVNADKHNQGAAKSFGGYKDSADIYWQLLDTLAEAMPNILLPTAHLIFWYSMDYYAETKKRLEDMGWRVNPFPLIWFKDDNPGILPDSERGPRRVYETAFFASYGDRKIVAAVSNVAAAPGRVKTIHMSEKSKIMLNKFFRMVVDEYTVMLDPTCGSANAIKVAERLGASHVLGLEMNEEFFNLAKEHYNDEPSLEL